VLAMVPSWWRHRREALRLAPASAPATATATASRNDTTNSEFVPEHPPREGL